MTDDSTLPQIYRGFILACVICLFIGMFSNGAVSYGAILAGYSLIILAIGIISIIILSSKNNMGSKMLYCLPCFLLLGIVGFLMYVNITNQTSIIANIVPPNFYGFSNTAIILILIQLWLFYNETKTVQFMETSKISKITISYIYLFEILTIMCSIVLYVLLTYFKTDG